MLNYIFPTTAQPAEFQEQFKFICHYPPNNKKFSFSESGTIFTHNLHNTNATEGKAKI